MKTISLVSCAVLAGCTLNSNEPVTSWGKAGISMLDYRTDSGQCALIGATYGYDGSGTRTAGTITGQNAGVPPLPPSGAAAASSAASGGTGATNAGSRNSPGASTSRDDATVSDYANRAAMQQRTEEMAAQRARNDALKFCLASRGYTEFELTREQRAKLAQLPRGSDERRDYLYSLATNADVLNAQKVAGK